MKKVLSMVAALLLCVGTQAQIVSSRSAIVKTEKQASSTQWFLRAGLNIMNFSGDGAEGADSNIGYNATFGYQKPLGSTGGYWGMEFGLGSRGFKVEDTKCMAHNIQYSPFTFGWKFAVADNVHIDPHVGVFASYDYTSKMKADGESISWGDYADYMEVDYNHFDAGMNHRCRSLVRPFQPGSHLSTRIHRYIQRCRRIQDQQLYDSSGYCLLRTTKPQ